MHVLIKNSWDDGKKSIDGPREESVTEDSERTPISEDPKENLANQKTKEDPITVKPKDNHINEDPKEVQYPP